MLEGGKISNRQLMFMMAFTVLGTAYFFLPAVAAAFAGRDFWLVPLFSTIPGLLVVLIIVKLHSLFPGLTIIQYVERILGRVAGKLAGLLFIFWLVHTNSIIIQEFGDFMNAAFMPLTPTPVFTVTITTLGALAVYYGVEMVARCAEFLFPVLLALALFILSLAASNIQPDMITPLLSKGFWPVLAGSLTPAAWQGEVVVAAMLLPFLNQPGQASFTGIVTVLFIGLMLFLNSLEVAMVFGEEAARLTFPVLSMVRDIELMNFFQRMEVFLLTAWIAGLFVKVTVFYYCAALALGQWSGTKSYRPLIIPLGVVLLSLASFNFRNVMELSSFISVVWPFYGLTLELLFPLVLLVTALITGKSRESG